MLRSVQRFSKQHGYWVERHGRVPEGEDELLEFHLAMFARLQRLARLSNVDKHRRLHLPWWSIRSTSAWCQGGDFGDSGRWEVVDGPWESGQLISWFILQPGNEEVPGSLHAELTVVLPGDMQLVDFNCADDLSNIAIFVSDALGYLDFELRSLHG